MSDPVQLATQTLDEAPSFTECQFRHISAGPIPRHVAIIPDGNRRWAVEDQCSETAGHLEGADSLTKIVKAAKELGVETITIYSFSTENWSRPEKEIGLLLKLIAHNLRHQCPAMVKYGVKLEVIGDVGALPSFLQEAIAETQEATRESDGITMVLALNYGGRDELVRATRRIAEDVQAGRLDPKDIKEDLIPEYLDTQPWGDPDLLIRTSGEMRVSNFLLWQISYSELYVTETLWPSFTPQHFFDAIVEYQKRERRLGGEG